ncbi:MAG: bifunctional proline dehydrogenase/L-glutamate gamma-semialdehyde dehydrogenase PutA, partial [Proteobacteria bacterium]|nr:bifunctional proline dehydrogenase/L-glutamate gamma-semialdehyde dehydrogenase PutA [Pseudomonadota bacterium]
MIIDPALADVDPLRAALRADIRAEETAIVRRLAAEAAFSEDARERVAARARGLVEEVRRARVGKGGLDAFLQEFGLSSKEGVVLMCLAEALLRVPDAETVDRLIKDKIAEADWRAHLGHSESLFVNASTWALMLTGRVVRLDAADTRDLAGTLKRLVHSSGEPVIRGGITQAMRILGRQFVMGRTIGEALARARDDEKRGYRHSYDMLGEAAYTRTDAERYFEAYHAAIAAIGKAAGDNGGGGGVIAAPGISVKLSALHPRYDFAQARRARGELTPRLLELAREAKRYDIGLTVDAEEASRLDLSLEVIEAVAGDPTLRGWDGFGLAVQAYQKRAPALIDWLAGLAARHKRRLMVRLVKGAYWDSEIKLAQEAGLDGYPVFTRKVSTDVCFLACARRLFADPKAFYPQFATHNAQTLAAVVELAGGSRDFEFQRLHGMGEALYDQVVGPEHLDLPVRIYAPVGSHEDLLAYLVRRLLENGANTSFVNRIVDEALPVEEIIADPVLGVGALDVIPHPRIPLPAQLYGAERRNSAGVDLADPNHLAPLGQAMAAAAAQTWTAAPLVGGEAVSGPARPVLDPADSAREVGRVVEATAADVDRALALAQAAAPDWDRLGGAARADCLARMADLMEANRAELLALCVREAGKTLPDAVAELREAVDFCRYYAARARADFAGPQVLPGPTGERNEVALHGRGVFACISPWNFPLAIFTGQVAAALAAGNAVLAKPAEQTPLVAAAAVRLW